MGEQLRSTAAEALYNRRWLVGLVLGPVLLALAAAAWMLGVAGSLPQELATHWNARNEVDGWMSLSGVVWMTLAMGALGAVIAPLAVLMRAQSALLARVGVGVGIAFAVGLVGLSVAMVAAQVDLADSSQAQLHGGVMAAGIAAAFVAAGAAWWAYRPGDVVRAENVEVAAVKAALAAADSPVALAARRQAAGGETLRLKVSMGRRGWLLSAGVGGLVALCTWFIWPWLALSGLVLGWLAWVFTAGTAVIGPDGVKVLAGGFWKVMPLAWKEVRSASVEHIAALDMGGWGYRMNGGSVGFITASGPAVVLEAGFSQRFVISMPDAATAARAAALADAYVQAQKVQR
ncbi:DUF1648 domain-containing protein [Specibacter sp. NPDC057265]|uniref:DUF1648 domain-containing protein n=1 Tax=Specibacter sp. NPDC057265 TaxID=3346075 RepID=UPI00363C19F8